MTFEFLRDTGTLNQAVIQLYLSGKLPLHLMRFIESSYEFDPVVRELFELQGARPFHLAIDSTSNDDSEFDEATFEELLEVAADLTVSAKIANEVEVQSLFYRLISQAAEAAVIGENDQATLRTLDLTGSGIDHLHHEVAVAADASGKKLELTSVQKYLTLDDGRLQLMYPQEMIPYGLVWIVHIGSNGIVHRQLMPLDLYPQTWIGSMPVHHLTPAPEPREEHFFAVPVTDVTEPGAGLQVQEFVNNLPDGAQRQIAQEWYRSLDNDQGESA